MAEKSNYLIAAFSLLCQFGATFGAIVLIFYYGVLRKSLSSSIHWQIIAVLTFLYFSTMILILRPERGNAVFEDCIFTFHLWSATVLFTMTGIPEYSIYNLLLSLSVPLVAFSLVDPNQISGIIYTPLINALFRTKGYLLFKIGIVFFMVVFLWVLIKRERRSVTAREEAEKLEIRKKKEAGARKK